MATAIATHPVDTTLPTDVAPVVESIGDRIRSEITRKEHMVKDLKESIATLKGILKAAEKQEKELIKKTLGKIKRSKVVDPNAPPREPSGITKPTEISSELAKFLSMEKGQLIARTEVTKAINKYVKEHALYDEQNKRVFILDKSKEGEALYKLLGSPDMKEVGSIGYFNLQRYMSPHFAKSAKAKAKAAAASN